MNATPDTPGPDTPGPDAPATPEAAGSSSAPTILVAYVPGATSEAALEFAVQEAGRRSSRLLVLASEKGPGHRRSQDVTDKRPLTERLEETGVPFDVRTVPERDDPADDILDALEQSGAELVVLGIRRRTPIGKILLGSTSQRVAMESPVPVVLVKPPSFVPPARY